MSTSELYNSTIRPLAPREKLQLASLILDDLASAAGTGLNVSDHWSDEDVTDVAAYSANHATRAVPNEEPSA